MIFKKSSIACAFLACSFLLGSSEAKYEDTSAFSNVYRQCIEVESGVTWDELNEDNVSQEKEEAYNRIWEAGPKWSTIREQAPNDPIVREIERIAGVARFNINDDTRVKDSLDLESGLPGGGKGYDSWKDKGEEINAEWTKKRFNRDCQDVGADDVFYRYNKRETKTVKIKGKWETKREITDEFDVRFINDKNMIVYSTCY